MVKKKKETVIRYCRDCVLSKPDMRFENLTLKGEPTLLSCPYQEWRMVITTTDVCVHYEDRNKPVEPEKPVEKKQAENWDDW